MFRRRQGQSTIEYMVLVTIILAVFLTMSQYFKRGVQGRWRAAIDDIGEQYDPRVTNSRVTHVLEANTVMVVTTVPGSIDGQNGVWTMRNDQTNSLETRSGGSTVGAF